jgi:hypothetical protein
LKKIGYALEFHLHHLFAGRAGVLECVEEFGYSLDEFHDLGKLIWQQVVNKVG